MTWGVMLTTDDGNEFITDESTPISLVGIYSKSGSGSVSISVNVNQNDVVLPFCISTGNTFFSYSINNGVLNVSARASSIDNSSFTMTCYLFSTAEQPLPKWGMALWNKDGKCILTHETKVLTDIQIIGSKGGSSSGLNLIATKKGKWAIVPELAGFYVGVYMQRPIQIGAAFTAKYNGEETVFYPVLNTQIPNGAQIGAPLDMKNSLHAIDVSRYE